WKYDRLAESALGACPMRTGTKAWEGQLLSAFDLYAGHFLAMEAEEAWMLAPRVRWKTRFERIVAALSSHFQHGKRFDEAVNICQRALEMDPLNEVHYRRLMSCYLELGETAAVARTYANCRYVLAKSLDAQPSYETERIQRMALERGHLSVRRLNSAESTGCAS
ncbi:MAG TPA: bacterial transcriptional activator domain-containing protein, partial [Burkholderiales bacterium]